VLDSFCFGCARPCSSVTRSPHWRHSGARDSRIACSATRAAIPALQTLIRGAQGMILESLLGLSLVMNVSLDIATTSANPAAWMQLSVRQKNAALLPLVRYAADMRPEEFNDLIVDSIAACARIVRAMIDAHDRMYGDGSGEAFLLGPYLDVLPAAVVKQVRVPAR